MYITLNKKILLLNVAYKTHSYMYAERVHGDFILLQ